MKPTTTILNSSSSFLSLKKIFKKTNLPIKSYHTKQTLSNKKIKEIQNGP